MSEIVYCLTNPAMPEYVKIGRTTNLEQRLKHLDNTSTPLPFECIYAVEVENSVEVERLIHDIFADSRTRKTREFFEIGPQRVIAAMNLATMNLSKGRDVTPLSDTVEDQESQVALNKARTRRANFNFSMVGITEGTELEFYDEPELKCTVLNQKQVLFEGQEISLSAAANLIVKRRRVEAGEPIPSWLEKNSGVQGPIYWVLNGESLDERRKRIEEEVEFAPE